MSIGRPLRWLLRPLGKLTHTVIAHLPLTLLAIAAAAFGRVACARHGAGGFQYRRPGHTPANRAARRVSLRATASSMKCSCSMAANVSAGQPLVRMRDPTLELELKRVDGELETAQQQLDAVRATKTNRAVRDPTPIDSYRLSAEERELRAEARQFAARTRIASAPSANNSSSPAPSPAACSTGMLATNFLRGRSNAAKCCHRGRSLGRLATGARCAG